MNIALDIGHANNTGSRGNGLEEHATASVIVDHLAPMLRAQGHAVTVIDFPRMDNDDDLAATVRAINAGGFDISISLHCDSAVRQPPAGPMSVTIVITMTTVPTRIPPPENVWQKPLPGSSASSCRAVLTMCRPALTGPVSPARPACTCSVRPFRRLCWWSAASLPTLGTPR